MTPSKYIILGGGMVAGYAAKELASRGLGSGELTIISADDSLPYERPPLSKGFLSGKDTEDGILINKLEWYEKQGIDVKLRTLIDTIDLKKKRLSAHSGEVFEYDTLLIATGARARKLDCPGNDSPNVFSLRSLSDSRKIREKAAGSKQAVVIGGGFIGMEVASVLSQKNIETSLVTAIHDLSARQVDISWREDDQQGQIPSCGTGCSPLIHCLVFQFEEVLRCQNQINMPRPRGCGKSKHHRPQPASLSIEPPERSLHRRHPQRAEYQTSHRHRSPKSEARSVNCDPPEGHRLCSNSPARERDTKKARTTTNMYGRAASSERYSGHSGVKVTVPHRVANFQDRQKLLRASADLRPAMSPHLLRSAQKV